MSFFSPSPIPFCGKKFYVIEELSFPLVFSYLGHLKLEWPQLEMWCPWSSPSPHAPWSRRLLLCAGMAQETFDTSCITRIDNGLWCALFLQRRSKEEWGLRKDLSDPSQKACAAVCSLECVCSLLQHS